MITRTITTSVLFAFGGRHMHARTYIILQGKLKHPVLELITIC